MTITRKKPGRENASAVPYKLPVTTRRSVLGAFGVLEGEGRAHHFSDADLAVLEPSMPALELATYLDKPAAWLADYRRAAKPFKPISSDAELDAIRELRSTRDHPPSQREDLIKKIRARSRELQRQIWRECRSNAKRWIRLVRAYELDRAWLHSSVKSNQARKKLVQQMADGVRRAWANEVEAESREEERRRARNRRELKKAAKRGRDSFGYKRKTDGWNCEGYRGKSYRNPTPIITHDGDIDSDAAKEAELLQLFASWQRDGKNSGIGIVQGLESEQGDQWSITEQQREAKRLTREAQEYKAFTRSRKV